MRPCFWARALRISKTSLCRGSESVWTRGLLAERGFAYTSNGFDDDLPYWDPATGGRLLVVPYALDSNDMKFFHPNGFVRAQEMVDYAADALVIEVTGDKGKVDAMLRALEPFGIKEIAQSGLLAIGRGGKSITERVLRG